MALHLYDTLRREVVEFLPLVPGRATIYVCGATVQARPHVGHLRPAVVFDVLRRWLAESGHDVVFVRNVTDIDDKILDAAAQSGRPWWAVSEENARAFRDAYEALRVLPPTVEPRATGHIPQMVDLISRLVDSGHAYASGGDVYFDVRSFADYGRLSGQRIDAMVETERNDPDRPKRDPLDFALWKAAKPGEPSWRTPWGAGRPGWHLECSAMSTYYLGETFDIHGGGMDLVFPHHENELAQSVCAGDGFARHWMHNGLVNIGAAKMSKSLGNSVFADEVLTRVRPVVLRYALLAAHYRSDLTWGETVLEEADAAYRRIEAMLRAVPESEAAGSGPAWERFSAAMDDDLALPRALAVLHTAVRDANTSLAAGNGAEAGELASQVRRMLAVLALEPSADVDPAAAGARDVLDGLVSLLLAERGEARQRRDFAAADRIRAELGRLGVVVEDTSEGARWHLS